MVLRQKYQKALVDSLTLGACPIVNRYLRRGSAYGIMKVDKRGEKMKTWILIATIMICEAINPGYNYPDNMIFAFTFFFILGCIIDIQDILRGGRPQR